MALGFPKLPSPQPETTIFLLRVGPQGVHGERCCDACCCRYGDGFGKYAHFNRPTGLSVDHVGTVFVADTGNHCVRQVERNGVVKTLAGAGGQAGDVDGWLTDARLCRPCSVAAGPGVLYVCDQVRPWAGPPHCSVLLQRGLQGWLAF